MEIIAKTATLFKTQTLTEIFHEKSTHFINILFLFLLMYQKGWTMLLSLFFSFFHEKRTVLYERSLVLISHRTYAMPNVLLWRAQISSSSFHPSQWSKILHLIRVFQNVIYCLLEDKVSHWYICLHAPGGIYGLYVQIGTIDEEKRIC